MMVGRIVSRSNVDQPGPRLTQQQEEKQKTFLIRLQDCARAEPVDRHRWHNDDCLRILIKTLDRFPQRHEFLLQPIELSL